MKNTDQARLFGTPDSGYKRFEDHQAAIQDWLHSLVEDAIGEKENPVALIEDFLHVRYTGGDTIDELINFLCNTHYMIHAFGILKANWDHLDDRVPPDSLLYATADIDDQKASEIYRETTLRNYLETLSQIYHG